MVGVISTFSMRETEVSTVKKHPDADGLYVEVRLDVD